MRAAGTPPVHIAGRGQDGDLQLHRGVVQSCPSPFWHPLSIPNRLRDTGAQGGPNDLSDKPSTKPGQLQTTAQGSRVATSVGGVLTGRGADLIVIDDPLKPEEALSQTQRQAANEWYDHTLYSRLNDKLTGAIVLIMHRLHESLPSGMTRGTTSSGDHATCEGCALSAAYPYGIRVG